MPHKTSTRVFVENQLRVLIAKKGAKPHTKLRALQTLIALCGFPQVTPKEIEPEVPEEHVEPVDDSIQQVLKQNAERRSNANKLPESSS